MSSNAMLQHISILRQPGLCFHLDNNLPGILASGGHSSPNEQKHFLIIISYDRYPFSTAGTSLLVTVIYILVLNL